MPVLSKDFRSHNLSRSFSSLDIEWQRSDCIWPGDCDVKLLRVLDGGLVRTAMVKLNENYASIGNVKLDCGIQGFVVEGSVTVGENVLSRWGFFSIPHGNNIPKVSANIDSKLILIFDNKKSLDSFHPSFYICSALDIKPIIPIIENVPVVGLERRVLWENKSSGADTRLLKVPAGFLGRGPNWHSVHEEIYCLDGDIAPDDSRLMVKDSYLHNPAYGVHGYREHSVSGATILEWHDGLWDINYL